MRSCDSGLDRCNPSAVEPGDMSRETFRRGGDVSVGYGGMNCGDGFSIAQGLLGIFGGMGGAILLDTSNTGWS
jgi:hypothetical protein